MSQNISPVYLKLANNEKDGVVEFLKNINTLPVFEKEVAQQKLVFPDIESAVFEEKKEELVLINNLEQMLEKNPKSRDILYSLNLLYRRDRNYERADEYLQRAKAVDPEIK